MQSQRSLNNYNFFLGGMFDALFPPNKEILYDTDYAPIHTMS